MSLPVLRWIASLLAVCGLCAQLAVAAFHTHPLPATENGYETAAAGPQSQNNGDDDEQHCSICLSLHAAAQFVAAAPPALSYPPHRPDAVDEQPVQTAISVPFCAAYRTRAPPLPAI